MGYCHLGAEARDAAEHPVVHETVPPPHPNKELPCSNISSAETENLWLNSSMHVFLFVKFEY